MGVIQKGEGELPEFTLPTCYKHWFKGNKVRCKECHAEVERQFREVCEAFWTLKIKEAEVNDRE